MRFLAAILLCLVGAHASALDVNGELKRAQLEKLASNPTALTARIYYNTADGVLKFYDGADWLTVADTTTAIINPMISTGDMVYGGASGAATRLATGATAGLLHGGNGAVPTWSAVVSADVTDGTLVNADLSASAALDAAKIGATTDVSNTEYGYLDGVTSAIQTQISAKQDGDTDLTAVAGLSSTGLVARTGSGTAAVRTVTAGTGIGVTNGDGVSGNPTVAIDSTVATLADVQTLTNKTLTSPKLNENVAVTTTATKLNYLTSATGTTGTASTNVVFSTSPTLITPALGTPTAIVLSSATGLPLTTGVTGTLPIPNGGTGQTSAAAAFAALSPLTTKGDLGAYSTTTTRQPVGADGTVLTADSAQTTGLTWTAPLTNPMDSAGDLIAGGALGAAIKVDSGTKGQRLQSEGAATETWGWQRTGAKSADYTITDTDGFDGIDMTTGSSDRTVTLPAAANNTGRTLTIRKIDSGTGQLVISGTINGFANINYAYQYDGGTIISNGTVWTFVDGFRATQRISAQFTFNGSGGNVTDVFMVERRGGTISVVLDAGFRATTGTGSTAFSCPAATLPTWARPPTTLDVPVTGLRNNGTGDSANIGDVSINSDGSITISRNAAALAFTNSANAGIQTPITLTINANRD